MWLQENKHGLVLHTRQMNTAEKNLLIIEIHNLFETKFQNIAYSSGKEIVEIKPSHLINKGKAIDWYLQKISSNIDINDLKIISAGDDRTDEDMFSKMNELNNGIAIKITNEDYRKVENQTGAKIIFKSVDNLYEFLNILEKTI